MRPAAYGVISLSSPLHCSFCQIYLCIHSDKPSSLRLLFSSDKPWGFWSKIYNFIVVARISCVIHNFSCVRLSWCFNIFKSFSLLKSYFCNSLFRSLEDLLILSKNHSHNPTRPWVVWSMIGVNFGSDISIKLYFCWC